MKFGISSSTDPQQAIRLGSDQNKTMHTVFDPGERKDEIVHSCSTFYKSFHEKSHYNWHNNLSFPVILPATRNSWNKRLNSVIAFDNLLFN